MSHKIVYETVQRLSFEAFIDQLQDEEEQSVLLFLEEMVDSSPESSMTTWTVQHLKK